MFIFFSSQECHRSLDTGEDHLVKPPSTPTCRFEAQDVDFMKHPTNLIKGKSMPSLRWIYLPITRKISQWQVRFLKKYILIFNNITTIFKIDVYQKIQWCGVKHMNVHTITYSITNIFSKKMYNFIYQLCCGMTKTSTYSHNKIIILSFKCCRQFSLNVVSFYMYYPLLPVAWLPSCRQPEGKKTFILFYIYVMRFFSTIDFALACFFSLQNII